jgi:ribonuclease VapC
VSNCVLDTSALLALLYGEPGHLVVSGFVTETGARMSAVNLSEAVAKLAERGWSEDEIYQRVTGVVFETRAFEAEDAFAAGFLRPLTRQARLSFGARACLALAQQLGLPAVTADRAWTTLGLPITVQVIR